MVEQSQTQVRVAASQTRCPFCHDQVQIEERHQVCATCLARHHNDCWTDHGSCSTCGYRSSLIPSEQNDAVNSMVSDYELRSLQGSLIESRFDGDELQFSWAQRSMSKRETTYFVCFFLTFVGGMSAGALESETGTVTLFCFPPIFLILMLFDSKQSLKAKLNLDSDGLTFSRPGQEVQRTLAWDDLASVHWNIESPFDGESNPHDRLAQHGLILKKRSGELKVGSSLNAIEAEWLKSEILRARDYFKSKKSSKKLDS